MEVVNTNGSDSGSAGWAVAVIVLLVVVAGGIFWYMRYHRGAAAAPGANIQVNLPTPTSGGNSGGSASGGQ